MSFFDQKNIKGDIFGGINAGIVALPAAIAFGELAQLTPLHGLYCAIFLGLVAAILGGTNTLISNPTGPMAVVAGGFMIILTSSKMLDIEGLSTAEQIEMLWPYLFFIFFIAGIFQVLFGVFKLGKYIHYIPTPVISGFMSGIGVIIIVSQIPKALGYTEKISGTDNIILALPELVSKSDWRSVLIALASVLVIYLFPKVTKQVPSALVAIVSITLVTFLLNIDASYLIPEIPQSIPRPDKQLGFLGQIDNLFFSDLAKEKGILLYVIFSGLTLAIIGMIDSLLTAVVADQLTKTKHNSDKELLGQGIGNMISSLFGGMMGAGTTPATVLNINSGGRNKLSGIIHAIFLITILLIAAPIASQIPKAALAGLLITVGISILDFEVFRTLKKIPKQDNIVMFVVLIITSFGDLMVAVAVGLIMAALIFMKKMADVVEGQSKDTKFDRLVDQLVGNFDNAEKFRKYVMVRNMQGPMFFGFASRFQDNMDEMPNDLKVVVLNFSGVTYMDQSGMYTLKESISRLVDKGVNVCLSEVKDEFQDLLRGINVIPGLIDEKHLFSSVEECVMWLNEPGHLENEFAADDELYIPSAYTPNGDGINDEWEIRNIQLFPNATVQVFTREGTLIFESKDYTSSPWEGIHQGRNLPSDTYPYKIDLGNGDPVKEGKVTIFR